MEKEKQMELDIDFVVFTKCRPDLYLNTLSSIFSHKISEAFLCMKMLMTDNHIDKTHCIGSRFQQSKRYLLTLKQINTDYVFPLACY